jgi:hypothetical protein
MGFDFMLMTMRYIEDVGYIIKKVNQCHFPIIRRAINEGEIQALIDCINFAKIN